MNETPKLTEYQVLVRGAAYAAAKELRPLLLTLGAHLSENNCEWGAEIVNEAVDLCRIYEIRYERLEAAWEEQRKLRSRNRQLHAEIRNLKAELVAGGEIEKEER